MSGDDCRRAMRDLLRQDRLDAVARGRLDLHLRRCAKCKDAAEAFAAIESRRIDLPAVTEAHQRAIYDRLVPSVHQIAVDLRPTNMPRRGRIAVAWNIGLATAATAAAVLIAVAFTRFVPSGEEAAQSPVIAVPQAVEMTSLPGVVDRAEGTIIVDGRSISSTDGSFTIRKGTEIAASHDARVDFRIGADIKLAIIGDTRWRIANATEAGIEMELDAGRLAVEFDGSSGRMLDVRTPDSIVRVRGTVFTVEVTPLRGTQVAVLEGRVDVVAAGDSTRVVELEEGRMVVVPGAEVLDIGDEQRALATQIAAFDDGFAVGAGRMVVFSGSPERVQVEIDGRHVGHSPLAIRVPEGTATYRLSAPGMEPFEAALENEQIGEHVSFELAPATSYQPVIVAGETVIGRKQEAQEPSRKTTPKISWGLVERAHAAMTAGDIPFAINLLERFAVESRGDKLVSALSLLAECYSSVGRYSEAADTYDRVAGLVPGTKIAQNSRYEVGRISMERLGDFARARAAYTAYVASPLDGELKEAAYYSLCKMDGRDGSHQEAIHCFNEFLRTFPGGFYEPDARLWRGALYQDVLKRWADAERDLTSFLKAKPRHPRCEEARYRIALGRYQVGDKRGALRMIDEHLREHPGGQYTVRAKRLRRAILDPDFSFDTE